MLWPHVLSIIRRGAWALIVVVIVNGAQSAVMIGGLDPSRSDESRSFSSDLYDNIRARLEDPNNFGPSGVADEAVKILPEVPLVTPDSLAGVDIFILAEVTSLSTDERDLLHEFVLAGHSLVLVADSLPIRTIAAHAMLQVLDGGLVVPPTGSLDDPRPIQTAGLFTAEVLSTNGPFGQLTGERFAASEGSRMIPGAASTVIGQTGVGTFDILIEIPPGALGPNSGSVLAMGDVLFSDFFVPPANEDDNENENNAGLFLNFVAAHALPEPSSFVALILTAALFGPSIGGRQSRSA